MSFLNSTTSHLEIINGRALFLLFKNGLGINTLFKDMLLPLAPTISESIQGASFSVVAVGPCVLQKDRNQFLN